MIKGFTRATRRGMIALLKSDCIYTSHYCEENVYQLLSQFPDSLQTHLYTVFCSNPTRSVFFWNQTLSQPNEPVIWDYHVFLVYLNQQEQISLVYDLDSLLSFPISCADYLDKGLVERDYPSQYQRFYRVIPGLVYKEYFSSNRSHMKRHEKWLSPPPTYPCLWNETLGHNLDNYINMIENKDSNVYGKVFTESEWKNWILQNLNSKCDTKE